jgi:acyl carrier protein
MGVCEATGIAAEVRNILVFHLGVEEALINGDVRLVDLGADSLDVIEIAMSCEEMFDIDISAKAAAKFVTLSDVVDFIEAHIAKGTDLAQSPRLIFA